MIRGFSILFGIGLGILWIVGLSSPEASGWMTWFVGLGALCAFIVAGSVSPWKAQGASRTPSGGPIALSIGLFALWIIGMAASVVPWLAWWTFAFACAFLVLGIASGSTLMGRTRVPYHSGDLGTDSRGSDGDLLTEEERRERDKRRSA